MMVADQRRRPSVKKTGVEAEVTWLFPTILFIKKKKLTVGTVFFFFHIGKYRDKVFKINLISYSVR